MPSPLTDDARKIIDTVAKNRPKLEPLQTADYRNELPLPRAQPLVDVISDQGVLNLAREYKDCNESAISAQRLHVWPRNIGVCAVLASVFLAGLSVYASASNSPALIAVVIPYLPWAQGGAFLIVLVCAAVMFRWSTASRTWVATRAQAERARAEFYAKLISLDDAKKVGGEVGAWQAALQLECFRCYLLEGQRRFFESRRERHRIYALLGKVFGVVAVVLIGAASVPQMVASLSTLGPFDRLPEELRGLVNNLVADRTLYALAWVYGTALQLAIARLAFTSPVTRHVERYEAIAKVLSMYEARLDDARQAAAAGLFDQVGWYVRGIQDTLEAERRMWYEREVLGRW